MPSPDVPELREIREALLSIAHDVDQIRRRNPEQHARLIGVHGDIMGVVARLDTLLAGAETCEAVYDTKTGKLLFCIGSGPVNMRQWEDRRVLVLPLPEPKEDADV